jgi:hypothetical protein
LRPTTFKIFFCIETGEVLADDLVRLISLDMFSADIPTRDISRRSQRENGVVANPLNQETESLLTSAQFFFCLRTPENLLREYLIGSRDLGGSFLYAEFQVAFRLGEFQLSLRARRSRASTAPDSATPGLAELA